MRAEPLRLLCEGFGPRTPLYVGEAAQSLVLRFVYRKIEGTAKEIKKLEFSYADAGVEEE